MRRTPLLAAFLTAWPLGGCSTTTGAAAPAVTRPDVAEVLPLAPGTRLHPELAPGLDDSPANRAALVWWREALRQSDRFDVDDEWDSGAAHRLLLAIEPASRRLSAFCTLPNGESKPVFGGVFEEGALPAGIDRLALATRLALGERDATAAPVALCTSPEVRAVLDVVDGQALLRDGGVQAATRAFLAARTRDGGSPFVLDGLASAYLLDRRAEEAERICLEALGYAPRLCPATRHHLARTLLLARAARRPDQAPDYDRDLATLAATYRRERPNDPQGQLTAAIAANFRGEFPAARDALVGLRRRFPGNAVVSYHLGWALLATGEADGALDAFADAAARLPENWLVIPQAMAMHAAGRDDELAKLLQRRLEETDARQFEQLHDLERMVAALALLRGDREAAAAAIKRSLNNLLAHPTLLDVRAGEFADAGEVLVRLGWGDDLPPLLAALQAQHPGAASADVAAFLSGMVEVARTRQRATALEERLGRGGENVFALRLCAFAHELRGEIADMHATLARVARLCDAPLVKAQLARSLRTMGRTAEATALRDALRADLTHINLRHRPNTPLLGPELALAYLVE